jgi:hypothetical protein
MIIGKLNIAINELPLFALAAIALIIVIIKL